MTDLEERQLDPKRGRSGHVAPRAGLDLARPRSRQPGSRAVRRRRSAAARRAAGVLVALGALLGLAAPALAGVAVTATPDPPSAVTVGQLSVPATVTVVNASNGVQAGMGLTLEAITFVPSCGTQAITGADCPGGGVDSGVLGLSATAAGQSGTACAGATFTASLVDAVGGKYQLIPSAPVVLGPVGSQNATCVIDFTVDVLKAPAQDADPATVGLQTIQIAAVRAVATDGNRGGSFGSNEVTIDPGIPPVIPPVTPPTGTAPSVAGAPTAPAAPVATGPTPPAATGVATTAAIGRALAAHTRPSRAHRPPRAHRARHRHPRHHRHVARHAAAGHHRK